MGEVQGTFEGFAVSGFRYTLKSIHLDEKRPRKSGDRVSITIDAIVSDIVHPYDSENESYKNRIHVLEPISYSIADKELDEEAVG